MTGMERNSLTVSAQEQTMELIVRQQHEQLMQLASLVQSIGTIVQTLDKRLDRIEKCMDRKLTVSSGKAKALTKAIRDRARAICAQYGLDYQKAGRRLRASILSAVRVQYGVEDIHDLQDAHYPLAIEFIATWSSYSLVKELRRQAGS